MTAPVSRRRLYAEPALLLHGRDRVFCQPGADISVGLHLHPLRLCLGRSSLGSHAHTWPGAQRYRAPRSPLPTPTARAGPATAGRGAGGSICTYDMACSRGSPQRGFAAGLGVFQLPAGSSTWRSIGSALPPGYIRTIDFVDSVGDLITDSHASGVCAAGEHRPLEAAEQGAERPTDAIHAGVERGARALHGRHKRLRPLRVSALHPAGAMGLGADGP